MKKYSYLAFLLIFSSNISAEFHEGKKLFYEQNCTDCHSVERFKYRADKISNFEKLHKIVDACSFNTDTGWFDDEVMSVSEYLNHHYYKFKNKNIKD